MNIISRHHLYLILQKVLQTENSPTQSESYKELER